MESRHSDIIRNFSQTEFNKTSCNGEMIKNSEFLFCCSLLRLLQTGRICEHIVYRNKLQNRTKYLNKINCLDYILNRIIGKYDFLIFHTYKKTGLNYCGHRLTYNVTFIQFHPKRKNAPN